MRSAGLSLAVMLGLLGSAVGSGCTEEPIQLALRSLQSSGPVAFVCLGDPDDDLASIARPLTDCSAQRAATTDDYSIPHLYALVTQPITGEIAVVDLTTNSDAVIDQDPSTPGSNFLPVGAMPTDIVATPGGTATFVTVAETSYEGIYALPSDMIRGDGAQHVSSWPACALPAAPGNITIAVDPADSNGLIRPSCEANYGDDDPNAECEGQTHCHGDLRNDAEAVGTPGRYKLIVTLPSEGGIAVIDAQDILDRDAGTRSPCTIERWLPLKVELPPLAQPPQPPSGYCVPTETPAGPTGNSFTPIPAGMTQDDGRLYIADRGAPVIHRLDMVSPCEPSELPPLVAYSDEDPSRTVVTTKVAISPLTIDFKRYLYAIDLIDGSIMVYDVSDDSTTTLPLRRNDAYTNPFQPADRLRFNVPPRDIIIVQHQNDTIDETTGSTIPVRCDPDPTSDGPGTAYQTEDFETGAAPLRLRGVFAFAVLASGDIVTIDIDDYDAACRGPTTQQAIFGCSDPLQQNIAASGEYTCNVVEPHQPRSAGFLVTADGVANNQPGLITFPSLRGADGNIIQASDAPDGSPLMRAGLVSESLSDNDSYNLVVGDEIRPLDPTTGALADETSNEHTLAMNLTDPRAHILDQDWTVTYEGQLPGFGAQFATLLEVSADQFEMRDVSVGFCDRGVVSQGAIADALVAIGTAPDEATAAAIPFADYVQVISDPPVEADPHWGQQDECTFNTCQAQYGSSEVPLEGRDLRIVEATDGTLELTARTGAGTPRLKCCFPGVVEFRVRGGSQWIANGSATGFVHHMTSDDAGRCRPSCDDDQRLLTSRVFEFDTDGNNGSLFRNPVFNFSIQSDASERDMQFKFRTRGSWQPLAVSVVTNDPDVQPQAVSYLPITGELVVSDGSLQGITLLDLNILAVTRQYN